VPATPKKKFSPEQDERIRELVGNQRFPDWNAITQQIEGKNARQFRERYQHYQAPEICPEPWTLEEDARLRALHAQLHNDWAKIAERMPGRTNTAVKDRFRLAGFRPNSTVARGESEVQAEVMGNDFDFTEYGMASLDGSLPDEPFMFS
jgi:hypothetical protein